MVVQLNLSRARAARTRLAHNEISDNIGPAFGEALKMNATLTSLEYASTAARRGDWDCAPSRFHPVAPAPSATPTNERPRLERRIHSAWSAWPPTTHALHVEKSEPPAHTGSKATT